MERKAAVAKRTIDHQPVENRKDVSTLEQTAIGPGWSVVCGHRMSVARPGYEAKAVPLSYRDRSVERGMCDEI